MPLQAAYYVSLLGGQGICSRLAGTVVGLAGSLARYRLRMARTGSGRGRGSGARLRCRGPRNVQEAGNVPRALRECFLGSMAASACAAIVRSANDNDTRCPPGSTKEETRARLRRGQRRQVSRRQPGRGPLPTLEAGGARRAIEVAVAAGIDSKAVRPGRLVCVRRGQGAGRFPGRQAGAAPDHQP
jgi:hypothetical protein